jgi:hypothetical protein
MQRQDIIIFSSDRHFVGGINIGDSEAKERTEI